MTNWLLRWVISGIALAIVASIHIGVEVKSALALVEATIVIGLLNSLVRPILAALTLPINCLTFGLFGFVLNAILFAAASTVVPGFRTDMLGAFLGSILMGLISGLLSAFLPDRKGRD